jgi:hypothetical protein
MLVQKIKEELALWSITGTKAVSIVMPREYAYLFSFDLAFWPSLGLLDPLNSSY